MLYIREFETAADYADARENDYIEPWVSYTDENQVVNYNKTEYEKLLETPLTFEITSNGVINWVANYDEDPITYTIQYKKNNDDWVSIESEKGSLAPKISVVSGDVIQFKGDNNSYYDIDSYGTTFSGSTCGFNIKGNIMSLIDSTNYAHIKSFVGDYNFSNLFEKCSGLTDASNLVLPATALTVNCYYFMFFGCTSLTTAPVLPATTLATGCYENMFHNCTSLTAAPVLPATTLANYCYHSMFQGCTSLTTAPVLPATTLVESCYNYMFEDCTALNYIKCLATNISASNCTGGWVMGVASTGTFVKAASMSNWTTGVNGIPANWAVQNA